MVDGLTDAFSNKPMGIFADSAPPGSASAVSAGRFRGRESCRPARPWPTRCSSTRSPRVSITVNGKTTTVSEDEGLNRFNEVKMCGLNAAFQDDGTVTAGNASSINNGAAAPLLASPESAVCWG